MPRGPSHTPHRHSMVPISRADALRVERLVSRVGWRGAANILNVGETTLQAAREEGVMLKKTRDKILFVLDIVDGWGKS